MFGFARRPDRVDHLEHLIIGLQHLIHHQNGRLTDMALDLSKLQPAVDRSVKASEALLAAHTDPAAQAAVDAAVKVLDDESVKAEAAVVPAVAVVTTA